LANPVERWGHIDGKIPTLTAATDLAK